MRPWFTSNSYRTRFADQIWRAPAASLTWPRRGVLPRSDFAVRLVKFGFHLVSQLELVFKLIVDPVTHGFDFLARQLQNRILNFFHRAHEAKLRQNHATEKPSLAADRTFTFNLQP